MTIDLPAAIAGYFAADKGRDAAAVAQCFAPDATVIDEANTYTGRDAIHRWKAETSAKFTYTVEPFAAATDGATTVVTSRVAGDFPGSPVDLRYFFALDGGAISRLEIVA